MVNILLIEYEDFKYIKLINNTQLIYISINYMIN